MSLISAGSPDAGFFLNIKLLNQASLWMMALNTPILEWHRSTTLLRWVPVILATLKEKMKKGEI